jgi:hypothetical protein
LPHVIFESNGNMDLSLGSGLINFPAISIHQYSLKSQISSISNLTSQMAGLFIWVVQNIQFQYPKEEQEWLNE